eukprot:jgi/Chlat1/5299/Chrsp35S08980
MAALCSALAHHQRPPLRAASTTLRACCRVLSASSARPQYSARAQTHETSTQRLFFLGKPITERNRYPTPSLARSFSTTKAVATVTMVPTLGLTAPAPVTEELPQVRASSTSAPKYSGDLLAVGLYKDAPFEGELAELDASFHGLIKELASDEDFAKEKGKSLVVRVPNSSVKWLAVVSLGESKDEAESWKSLGAFAAKTAKAQKVETMGLAAFGNGGERDEEANAKLATLGSILAAFEDARFKSKSKPSSLKSVELLNISADVSDAINAGVAISRGIILARQMVGAPPNVLTPAAMAETAKEVADAQPSVMKLKIMDESKCAELKMGAYLGVSAASENPGKFIHLIYTPPGGASRKLAIVGKGLTFDSGGYNIKAGAGSMIELMKFDMGGAAAAIGAAKALSEIQPAGVEVHFIVAACENMISGKGMRPGDILTASNGTTIEVNNTDAEGRLTLADALVYAGNLGVEATVDLATLTGACIIALGDGIAGLFTPNDNMAEQLDRASKLVGEKFWRLPLEASYFEMMKSSVADMKNTGLRGAGSITAALFLQKFVKEGMEWAHLDIAGPVWQKDAPTGFGVATLVEWVQHRAKQ